MVDGAYHDVIFVAAVAVLDFVADVVGLEI